MQGDFKGIVSNVTLNGTTLSNWTMYPLNIGQAANHPYLLKQLPREKTFTLKKLKGKLPFSPARIFIGAQLPKPELSMEFMPDSFIDPTNWGKGNSTSYGP